MKFAAGGIVTAMSIAAGISSARKCVSIAQPTTLRENEVTPANSTAQE